MPTYLDKTIGLAGRDYATLALWIAGCPANLVTTDQIYRGLVDNGGEVVTASIFTISGITVDATRYIELTAGTGESFQDDAQVRGTNLFDYNAAVGAALKFTAAESNNLVLSVAYTRVHKLQIWGSANSARTITTTVSNCLLKDLFVKASGTGSLPQIFVGTATTLANVCLVLTSTNSIAFGLRYSNSTLFIGCAAIRTTTNSASGTGYDTAQGYTTAHVMQSCVSFGFTTAAAASHWDTTNSKYNATDQSSGLPGTNQTYSVTYNATTPFVQASNTATDLKAIASTALAAAGFLDATNAPLDISLYTRAASPTAGHWEITAATTATPLKPLFVLQAVKRASLW